MTFAYAGTPDFGARVLGRLLERGLAPALVVTQPPRPAGRGRKEARSAVAAEALSEGLPLVETADINSPDVVARLRAAGATALVVAAFGQMLRTPILDGFECLNVHASLLPRYRGAAPIARALMAGDGETGVCVMRMTPGLDEGPTAATATVSIGLWQDAGDVAGVLALLGADAVAHVLESGASDRIRWRDQVGEPVYAAKLTATDQVLDLGLAARAAHDTVRALSPDIGARVRLGALDVKLWRTWPHEHPAAPVAGRSGAIEVRDGRLFLGCASGSLEVLALQPAGKKRMGAADFLRGYAPALEQKNTGQ